MAWIDTNPDQLSCFLESMKEHRLRFFSKHLCSEPAWDMLLLLHCARLKGEKVAVSNVATAGGCPQATGLRWLRVMEDRGAVVRISHPTDRRSVFVELAPDTRAAMVKYLESMVSTPPRDYGVPVTPVMTGAIPVKAGDIERRKKALPLMEESLELLDPVHCPGAALLCLAITDLKEELGSLTGEPDGTDA